MKPSSLCSLLSFICCTAILHQCIAVPPSFDLVGPFPLVSGNSSLQLVALVSGVRSSADVDYLEWCTFAFELFANGRMNEPVLRTGSNHPVAVEGDGSVLLRRTIDGLEAGAQYRSRVTSSCEGGRYTQTTPASDFIIMPSCGNGVVEPGEECDAEGETCQGCRRIRSRLSLDEAGAGWHGYGISVGLSDAMDMLVAHERSQAVLPAALARTHAHLMLATQAQSRLHQAALELEEWMWTGAVVSMLLIVCVAVATHTHARRMWRRDVGRADREIISTRAEYKEKLRVLGDKYQTVKRDLASEQRRLDQALSAAHAQHAAEMAKVHVKHEDKLRDATNEAQAQREEANELRRQLEMLQAELAAKDDALARGSAEAEKAAQTIEAQTEHISQLEAVTASIRRHYETQVDGKQQVIRTLQGKITRKDTVLRDSLAEATELLARTSPLRPSPLNTPLGRQQGKLVAGASEPATPMGAA